MAIDPGVPATANGANLRRLRRVLQHEFDIGWLYRRIAELEPAETARHVLLGMAAAEDQHIAQMRARLAAAGQEIRLHPSRRARLLAALARRGGTRLVLPILRDSEAGMSRSAGSAQARRESRRHWQMLSALERQPGGAGSEGIASIEGRHPFLGGNALRAAVLGLNDGLVSNFCLVTGVAGAALTQHQVLLTGCAGLIAGAISMALGEWLSVQSARELFQRQIDVEREEIASAPEEEARELALLYRARGMDEQAARELAERLMADPERALDAVVREELGIDPDTLGGSAWTAALTSFGLFSLGASVPLLPYLLQHGDAARWGSAAASAVALFATGASISLMTGRNAWWSGLRQVLFGTGAAVATFFIGRAFGVALAG